MNCEEYAEDLTAYIHAGLEESRAAEVERHLAECPDCRAELAAQRACLALLRRSWAGAEAGVPADFAGRVLGRLHEDVDGADEAQGGAGRREGSASARHYRQIQLPLTQRVGEGLRRSPYLAASLILHAAAAMIIIALLIRAEPQPVVITTTAIEPEGVAYTQDIRQSVVMSAWLERRERPSVLLRAAPVEGGVALDIPQFVEDQALTLVDDPELGCIKAYYSAEAVSGQTVQARRSVVTIPARLAGLRFGGETLLRAIELGDRLEFWTERGWLELTAGATGMALRGGRAGDNGSTAYSAGVAGAAILPGRRRGLAQAREFFA